jgi:peptide methionine sulfoxide reductase msrA/msrB
MDPLSDEEGSVIVRKGTERPFTGKYWNFNGNGDYLCRQCGPLLYRSSDKFDCGCGWPAFDDEYPRSVHRQTDADGRRTEITCEKCGGHFGRVFLGERMIDKNTRHCVNSLSIVFVSTEQ